MGKALGRGLDSIKKKKTFKGLRALIRTTDEDEDEDSAQEEKYRELKSEYNKKKRQLMDKRNLFYKLKQEIVIQQLQEEEGSEGGVADLKKLEDEIQVMEREMDEILLNMTKMERDLKTDDGQDLAIVREGYLSRHEEKPKEDEQKGEPSKELEEEKEAIAKESVDTEDLAAEINDDKDLLEDIIKESIPDEPSVTVPEPVIDDTEIEQAYVADDVDNEDMIYSEVEEEEVVIEEDDIEEFEEVEIPDVPIPEYDMSTAVPGADDEEETPDAKDDIGASQIEPEVIQTESSEDIPQEPEADDELEPGADDGLEPDAEDELEPAMQDEPELELDDGPGAVESSQEEPPGELEPLEEIEPDDLPDVDIAALENVPIYDSADEEEPDEPEEELDPMGDAVPAVEPLESPDDDISEKELGDLKHFRGLPLMVEDDSLADGNVVEYDQDDIQSWEEEEKVPGGDAVTGDPVVAAYEQEVNADKLYDDSKIKSKMGEMKQIEQGLSQVDSEINKLQEQITDMDGEAEYWEILHEKGFALSRIGQYDEAIYYYDKALQLNPENEEILSNKGVALFNMDQPEDAKACFALALKTDPTYEKAWNNLGVVMRAEGKLPEALRCYNQAIKANPFYKNAWYNKGFILEDMGDLEEALKYYNKAIEISPNYAEAIYYRDECLAKLAASRLREKEQMERAYEEEIAELDKQLQEELDTTFEDELPPEPESADDDLEPGAGPEGVNGNIPVRRPKTAGGVPVRKPKGMDVLVKKPKKKKKKVVKRKVKGG